MACEAEHWAKQVHAWVLHERFLNLARYAPYLRNARVGRSMQYPSFYMHLLFSHKWEMHDGIRSSMHTQLEHLRVESVHARRGLRPAWRATTAKGVCTAQLGTAQNPKHCTRTVHAHSTVTTPARSASKELESSRVTAGMCGNVPTSQCRNMQKGIIKLSEEVNTAPPQAPHKEPCSPRRGAALQMHSAAAAAGAHTG